MFDYGGEQMAFYVGMELGDLIIVSLNKYEMDLCKKMTAANFWYSAVEAALAIILLLKCEYVVPLLPRKLWGQIAFYS